MKTAIQNTLMRPLVLLVAGLVSLAGGGAHADDVEIYLTDPPKPVEPNVLFVLDESGSMGTIAQCSRWERQEGRLECVEGRVTRMDQLKEAMNTILDDPEMATVRAALMGYTTTRDGNNKPLRIRVIHDFRILGEIGSSARTTMKSQVATLTPRSYTPTVKALEFAVDWFYDGFNIKNHPVGYKKNDDNGDGIPYKEDKPKNTWKSPLDLWCRSNHIVLLTDGRPNSNSPTKGEKYGLTKYRENDPYGSKECEKSKTTNWQNGRCAAEIAYWANKTDLRTDKYFPKQQNIVTHTLGFHTNSTADKFLENVAKKGGGKFYKAGDTSDLIGAFSEILKNAKTSISYTYNAPAIPYNPNNRAESGDEIYVPLFKPDTKKFWKGNLKKYKLSYDKDKDENKLLDKNGKDVLDDDLNFLDRVDLWNSTGTSDEGDPLSGGAVSYMHGDKVKRKLYTYLDTASEPTKLLIRPVNRVHVENLEITQALLAVTSASEREELLNWINWVQWKDPDDKDKGTEGIQGVMGAPLHTSPVVVRYEGENDLVFLTTTQGILHAFDGKTGKEAWAFIPRELLNTLKISKESPSATVPQYGLDGPITYYELDGVKFLVFGMRRGGRNYYALDVTDRARPRFAWKIEAKGAFKFLGQTWSKPLYLKMSINGADPRPVLVFGGGYDPDQDKKTARSPDDWGNAIYIVDPMNGALIEKIDNDEMVGGGMNNAIAADLVPIDINTDGVTDRLYAADVGGRILRIDIPDKALSAITGISKITGTVVADVGGADGFQRFFNPPEVSYFNRGGESYLALSIASGFRPSPLDTSVTDRIYMFKDPNIWHAPLDKPASQGGDVNDLPDYPEPITEADLYDATANEVQQCPPDVNPEDCESAKAKAKAAVKAASGWYIDLETGEKGFSRPKVYDYAVLLTTYKGEKTSTTDRCQASNTQGESRLYIVDMTDGSAKFNVVNGAFDPKSSHTLDKSDRYMVLGIPGMPPSPQLIFPKTAAEGGDEATIGGVVKAQVGLQSVVKWKDRFHPMSWEEVTQ